MKRIEIELYHEGMFTEINSKELCITYIHTPMYKGLQSEYNEDDDRYVEQMKICSEITRLVKRLDEISLK